MNKCCAESEKRGARIMLNILYPYLSDEARDKFDKIHAQAIFEAREEGRNEAMQDVLASKLLKHTGGKA